MIPVYGCKNEKRELIVQAQAIVHIVISIAEFCSELGGENTSMQAINLKLRLRQRVSINDETCRVKWCRLTPKLDSNLYIDFTWLTRYLRSVLIREFRCDRYLGRRTWQFERPNQQQANKFSHVFGKLHLTGGKGVNNNAKRP